MIIFHSFIIIHHQIPLTFANRQDQTSGAMQHTLTLKMPSAKVAEANGSVASLASATSKRKKQEFADMVVECQNVIGAWSSEIEGYISKGREQPQSPFEEIEVCFFPLPELPPLSFP